MGLTCGLPTNILQTCLTLTLTTNPSVDYNTQSRDTLEVEVDYVGDMAYET